MDFFLSRIFLKSFFNLFFLISIFHREGKGIDLWPSPKRLEYNENKIAALKAAKATHQEIKIYTDRLKYLEEEANLHKIVKRTFEEVASDEDKKYITYEDFLKAVANTDFVGKLCIIN